MERLQIGVQGLALGSEIRDPPQVVELWVVELMANIGLCTSILLVKQVL